MRIGFTGTRKGMSALQYKTVMSLVMDFRPEWAGHGDCIGSDTDFHKICVFLRGSTTNPGPPRLHLFPANSLQRANNEPWDVIEPPKDPLLRNRDIAKWCNKLIATPKEEDGIIRSGTWATVRYAIQFGKVIYIVLPNGKIK